MKKILFMMVFCLVLLTAVSYAETPVKITASGSGSVSVEPDLMRVTANVTSMDKELSVAQENVSNTVNAIHAALSALGIEANDVVTIGYNCNTIYDYTETPYKLNGYQTSHSLAITCRDISLVDAVLGTLAGNGMTEVYGIEFDVSNRKELYLNALGLAVEAAQEKAAVLAGAASLEQYSISTITENESYGYSNYMAKEAAMDGATGNSGIHSGNISIDASVTVQFEAK
ncbi:MAG: SIMPL domain-containing protein [Clostridia bacterium]|nr:SIMPL domain-containing protein [Clostridia bacterium]